MDLPEYLHFSSHPDEILRQILKSFAPDQVAILVDEHTKVHCLPSLSASFPIIEIKSGEENKTIETCGKIWAELTELGFSRKSVLVNLGGGVIGDMGGFAASTYKRGIRFINFPTTLLSMVDASIGGKLGVDFNGLKNHIGLFREPDAVVICDVFLKTLADRQIKSGFAEVLKHGLILDRNYWNLAKTLELNDTDWGEIIPHSIEIKHKVVQVDPMESGLRKVLNFGHTLGHAIETYYLGTPTELLHGEAIAIGMVLEGYLSHLKTGMSKVELDELVTTIKTHYELPELPRLEDLTKVLYQDKKNNRGELNFALLRGIGDCHYDVVVHLNEISLAIDYYHQVR